MRQSASAPSITTDAPAAPTAVDEGAVAAGLLVTLVGCWGGGWS